MEDSDKQVLERAKVNNENLSNLIKDTDNKLQTEYTEKEIQFSIQEDIEQKRAKKQEEWEKRTQRSAFQIGKGSSMVMAHGLAFPPDFGDKPEHYTMEAIKEYWLTHTPVHDEHKTFGQVVLETLLDRKSVPLFAEALVSVELNKRVNHTGMLYLYDFCNCPIEWTELLLHFRGLSIVFDNDVDNIPLLKYMKVTEVIALLPSNERAYAIAMLERIVKGDITKIAEIADLKNVKYIMSRLKIVNATSLLHQLFASPTRTGKITALIKLIELYDILWADVAWTSVEKFAEFLLNIFNWIMEKTQLAKDFLLAGYDWVAAKIDDMKPTHKNEKTSNTTVGVIAEKQADTSTFVCANCKAEAYGGCYLCGKHVCFICHDLGKRPCNCNSNSNFFHLMEDCHCDNNMDCLFRAYSEQVGFPVEKFKDHIARSLTSPVFKKKYEDFAAIFESSFILDYESFCDQIIEQLKIHNKCDELMCLAIYLTMKIPVIILRTEQLQVGEVTTSYGLVSDMTAGKVVTLHLDSNVEHYESFYSEILDYPDFFLWGEAFDKTLLVEYWGNKLTSELTKRQNEKNLINKIIKTPPPKIITPQIINADELLDEDTISEISSDFTTTTDSDISEMRAEINKYVKLAEDSTSRRPNNGGDCSNNSEEIAQNLKNEEGPQKSFIELLKNFEFNEIGKRVAEWFKKCSKDVLLWFQDNPLFTGIISLIVGIASFLGINVTCFSGNVQSLSILRRFTEATRSMYYAEKGVSTILKAFDSTMSAARDMLGISKNADLDKFMEHVASVHDLAKEMLAKASNRPGDFLNDGQKFQEFRKDLDIIKRTYHDLAKITSSAELTKIAPIWHALNRTYEQLNITYNKMMNSAMTRQEPVVVYLWGGTGVGKSALTTYLINKLNEKQGTQLQTFTVSHGPEFWNGFSQQKIVRMDDMNAVIGPEGDTDSVALFNLATNAPYNPNMANLEDKNMMANPTFVFVASNHPTVPSDSVVQLREPWERRRDVFVHVHWPGHENCPKNTQNCECWQKIVRHEFDHLELTLCDPIVSSPMTVTTTKQRMDRHKHKKYDSRYSEKNKDEIVQEGERIDVNTLLSIIIGKEAERKKDFEERVAQSILAGSIKQARSWVQNPTILLLGPPGTGKSHVLQRYEEKNPGKIRKIVTLEDFSRFADQGFKNKEPTTVIFNDLSLLKDHDKFKTLLEFIQTRYDSNVEPTDVWILAANEMVLVDTIVKLTNEEMVSVIFRRCEIIKTSFKPKKMCFLKKAFTSERAALKNTVSDIKDYTRIDEYVQYFHNDEKITQETAVNRLSIMKPKVVDVKLANCLVKTSELPVTCVFQIPKTSAQFIDMVNNMSVLKILDLLRSGSVKTMSKTLTAQDIIGKLQTMLNNSKGMEGNSFDTIDNLLLEAWNKNLLKVFAGNCLVLKLQDKMYYINAIDERAIQCGLFESSNDKVISLVKELNMTVETVRINDIVAKRGLLPHWFVLAGETISTILSFLITGVAAVCSVQDQREMFESQKFVLRLSDTINGGTSKIQDNIIHRVQASMENSGPKFYPGKKNIKRPQYGDIINENPFEIADGTGGDRYDKRHLPLRREDDTAENRNNSRGFNPRHRREVIPNFTDVRDEVVDVIPEYAHEVPKLSHNRTGVSLETINFQLSISDVKKNDCDKQIKKTFNKMQDLNKEICTDPALYSIIDKMLKNSVEICDQSGHRLCSGLIVRGRCVRTVAHLLEHVKPHNLRVRTLDGRVWPVVVVYQHDLTDRLDIQISDPTFPIAADITNHFPEMSDTIAPGSHAVLVTPHLQLINNQVNVYIRSYQVNNLLTKNFANYSIGLYAIEYQGHRTGYKMTGLETRDGDCGSYLILLDTSWQSGKVIGVHVAASGKLGYASPLRRQQYDDKVKFQVCHQRPPTTDLFEPVVSEDPNLVAKCKIKNHIPSKTKLYKNWYPIGPKLYEPSILSSHDTRGDGRSLLRDESLKWCKEREGLTSEVRKDLEECMEEFAYHYVNVFRQKNVVLRKLTSTEALNKLKHSNCSEPINTHTSAGFPFNKFTQLPGKTAYITVGDNGERRFNKDPLNQKALNFLMEEINKLEHEFQGRHSDVIFQCYLKDELVKLKKIYDSPKTRTIAAAPLHFIITYRKYFYAVHVAMMENWDVIGPKIGISPTSLDWHTLMTNMLSVSTHGIDLDFSGWDFSHDPFIISLIPKFYMTLYDELDPNVTVEDQAVRVTLYNKIINFYLLVGNDLYRSTGGIPSGYPGTSPDNSIINEFLQYYIYKKIMRTASPSHANITSFYQDVCPNTYGDDTDTAISKWASQWYHGQSMAEEFKKLGFQAQAADKEGQIVQIKPLKDTIFLSRRFVLKHGVWTAPLQYPNLCKPTHYSHDRRSHHFWESPDEEIQAQDIVQGVYESLLYNAALESEEVFKEFYAVAEKVMHETNGPELPSYSDALQAIYGVTPHKQEIQGITLHPMSYVLQLPWQHSIPENHRKMSNRVTYSYGPKYTYTGAPQTNPIPKNLIKVLDYVNGYLNKKYNSILVNIYPIGGEIPWHKDDEPELIVSEGVFGLTLEGDGFIQFKNKQTSQGFYLDPGVGYMMDEFNLSEYYHRRIKHFKKTITMTFRRLEPRN